MFTYCTYSTITTLGKDDRSLYPEGYRNQYLFRPFSERGGRERQQATVLPIIEPILGLCCGSSGLGKQQMLRNSLKNSLTAITPYCIADQSAGHLYQFAYKHKLIAYSIQYKTVFNIAYSQMD